MKHYLYRHIRLDKNEPFYIGIGTKSDRKHPNLKSEYRRAYETIRKESSIWNKIINKTEYDVEILFESDNYDFIKEKEIEFIILYGRISKNTGCLANLTDGGDGSVGYKPSQKQIEKHRQFMLGRKQSKETILKRNKSRKGYKHTEETKRKMSKSHKGKIVEKKHFKKLIEGGIKHRSKPISQYDLNGKFIKNWPSATVAANKLGTHLSNIRNCVTGIQKTAVGFKWTAQISYI